MYPAVIGNSFNETYGICGIELAELSVFDDVLDDRMHVLEPVELIYVSGIHAGLVLLSVRQRQLIFSKEYIGKLLRRIDVELEAREIVDPRASVFEPSGILFVKSVKPLPRDIHSAALDGIQGYYEREFDIVEELLNLFVLIYISFEHLGDDHVRIELKRSRDNGLAFVFRGLVKQRQLLCFLLLFYRICKRCHAHIQSLKISLAFDLVAYIPCYHRIENSLHRP